MNSRSYKFGAVSGVLGAVLLFAGTSLHPMQADPNDPVAAFSEYAADRHWVTSHLTQLAGVTLIVGALLVLARELESGGRAVLPRIASAPSLAAIIHKFGVSVDFLRKFRAESVFRCDYKASKLVEPNRDEARAPSGNSSARRGLYICVGAGSQGTVRWDTDGASVMRRAFVRDKTMPGAPRCDEKFPEPGHRF